MSKLEVKDHIENCMYAAFNIASKILFSISKYKSVTKQNIKFKDMHKGERCFILGTGPSLKNLDYDLLKNEIIFGVNYLYKGEVIKYIAPDYYCLYDEGFYNELLSDTKEVLGILADTTFFFRTKAYDVINKLNVNNKRIYYQHCNSVQYKDHISIDLTKNITAPFNVVVGCIQTAIYMGFSEIYLLGCDFNSFATPKIQHYYDKGELADRSLTLGLELKSYALVCYHHYALEKYAVSHGIKIYNITSGSLLDAYERKSVNDVLSDKRK